MIFFCAVRENGLSPVPSAIIRNEKRSD